MYLCLQMQEFLVFCRHVLFPFHVWMLRPFSLMIPVNIPLTAIGQLCGRTSLSQPSLIISDSLHETYHSFQGCSMKQATYGS